MSHVTAFSTPTSLHPSSSPFSDHYHQTSPMHILTLHQYQYDMGSVIDWRRKTIKFFKKNLCTDHLMNQHQLSLHTYHAVHLLRYEPCIISFFFFFLFKNDSLYCPYFHMPLCLLSNQYGDSQFGVKLHSWLTSLSLMSHTYPIPNPRVQIRQ